MKLSIPTLFLLLCLPLMFLCSSWSLRSVVVEVSVSHYEQLKPVKPLKDSQKAKYKKPSPDFDYGDRTQLSAFLLCVLLGFTGAHHFYMKHYISGVLQLSFGLISVLLSTLGIALFFSWLLIIALFAWVAVDVLLIILGGLRLKKGKKLIPWDR